MSLPQKPLREHASLVSPAKINVRLKVTGRREDGYHLLSMINSTVTLHDRIEITLTDGNGIELSADWKLPGSAPADFFDPEKNLAARAFRLFRSEFGVRAGATIKITKNIPLGGGLGGGSGNAAAIFNFLCEAFAQALPANAVPRTHAIAVALGADIPYQMSGGLALVGGVGEAIVPIRAPSFGGEPVVLVLPPFGVSTAQVFDRLRAAPLSEFSVDESAAFLSEVARRGGECNRSEMLSLIDNDLFPIARALEPALGDLYQELSLNPQWIVSMSGSGSTLLVFSKAREPEGALTAAVQQKIAAFDARCVGAAVDCAHR